MHQLSIWIYTRNHTKLTAGAFGEYLWDFQIFEILVLTFDDISQLFFDIKTFDMCGHVLKFQKMSKIRNKMSMAIRIIHKCPQYQQMSSKIKNVLQCSWIRPNFLKLPRSHKMSEISRSDHLTSINVQKSPERSKNNNERPQIFRNVLKCPQCP